MALTQVQGGMISSLPSGSVIQVVTATAASFNTTSTTLVATGLSASITPKLSTSKIIVQVSWDPYQTSTNAEFNGTLYKNGSSAYAYLFDGYYASSTGIYSSTTSYFESPGSTATITYAMYLRNGNSSSSVYTNGSGQNQRMIIWEIAA
jgi:hypothetical protein